MAKSPRGQAAAADGQNDPFFSAQTSETSGYKKPDDDEVIEQFHKARGNVCLAARRMGVSDRQVRRWVEKSDLLKQALAEARDHAEEWVTSKLFERIEGVWVEGKSGEAYKDPPNMTGIIFYLKCQAGWSENPSTEKEDNARALVEGLSRLIIDASNKHDPTE